VADLPTASGPAGESERADAPATAERAGAHERLPLRVVAGILLMVASLWMAVATPAVGVFSDTRRWRHGRRRPFLLLFTVPYAVLSWLLFSDFGLTTAAAFVYFLVVSCLFALMFALVQVPYTALAAEITPDYNERTRLVSYRTAVSELAAMGGTVLPLLLVSWLAPALGSRELAWSVMAGVLAVTCILPRSQPGYPPAATSAPTRSSRPACARSGARRAATARCCTRWPRSRRSTRPPPCSPPSLCTS